MKENKNMDIIVFNDEDINLEVNISSDEQTVWLTQSDLAYLFETSTDNIGLHIKNVYSEGELDNLATTEEFSVVRKEGNRKVTRKILHYNLDVAISVGYRVKSKRATLFRIWATSVLRDYSLRGYAINQQRLNYETQLQLFKILDRSSSQLDSKDVLSILKEYTLALQLLDDYDHQIISKPEGSKSTYVLTYDECISIVNKMRKEHDSDVFGIERGGEFKSSINTIYATFDGEELYPSFEEKSAHLLYFLVKNHGFIDGNKRIGASIFIYFLEKNDYLYVDGVQMIDNKTLVTLTIMLAESNPNEKELLINLIMNLLKV